MIQRPQFNLEVYIENTSLEIDDVVYSNFLVYETLHIGIYYGKLIFHNKSPIFKDYPFISGTQISVEVEVIDDDTYTFDFILFTKNETKNFVTITLLPKIYMNGLGKDKICAGYNDKIDSIVSTIASDVGITDTDIENTSLPSRLFLQLNQTNFSFIKSNLKYAKNNNSNYVFFIDKVNKLKFHSIARLKQKNSVYSITSEYIDNLEIDDKILQSQLEFGFGSKGYYFNWEDGSIVEHTIDKGAIEGADKIADLIGVNSNYINELNNIVMLNPICDDLFPSEDYNIATMENDVLRKNYFNIFLKFNTGGNMLASPAELAEIEFVSSKPNETNVFYSGKWVIYTAIHSFPIAGFFTYLEVANSFLYGVNNPNFV